MLTATQQLLRSTAHLLVVSAVAALLMATIRGCYSDMKIYEAEVARTNNAALENMVRAGADPIAARCAIERDASSPQCVLAVARSTR